MMRLLVIVVLGALLLGGYKVTWAEEPASTDPFAKLRSDVSDKGETTMLGPLSGLVARSLSTLGLWTAVDAAAESVSEAIESWSKDPEPAVRALIPQTEDDVALLTRAYAFGIRLLDFMIFMESRGNEAVFHAQPFMPHFLINGDAEEMKARKKDTSFGWYGLTAVGMAEAHDVYGDLVKMSIEGTADQKVSAMREIKVAEKIAESVARAGANIPEYQSFYALLLMKSNYHQLNRSESYPTYERLLDDLLKTYRAWNRGPDSMFESRVLEYEDTFGDDGSFYALGAASTR